MSPEIAVFGARVLTGTKELGDVAFGKLAGGFGALWTKINRLPGVNYGERYTYNAVENTGPLSELQGNPASNFAGGKYNLKELKESTELYRAGKSGGGRNALGQWFRREPISS